MIRARTDMSRIAPAFREIARARGRPLAEVMRASGRRIAVRLVKYTQPFGFDDGAKRAGEGAIEGDVRGLFSGAGKMYDRIKRKSEDAARGFWKAYQDGDEAEMARISNSVGLEVRIIQEPDKGLHDKARNNRGRVAQSMIGRYFVSNAEALARYIDDIKKRVGVSAAGWAEAAKTLGGYRGLRAGDSVPNWKKARGRRHGGAASVTSVERDPRVTMENNVDWLTQICPEVTMNKAIREERETTERELERALQHELRKAGFRV